MFHQAAGALDSAFGEEPPFGGEHLKLPKNEKHLLRSHSLGGGNLGGDAADFLGGQVAQDFGTHLFADTHQEHGGLAGAGQRRRLCMGGIGHDRDSFS